MMPADVGMSDKPDMMDAKPEDEGRKGAILVTATDHDPTAERVILQLQQSRCTKRCSFLSFLLHCTDGYSVGLLLRSYSLGSSIPGNLNPPLHIFKEDEKPHNL